MKRPRILPVHSTSKAILKVASLLVPRQNRDEWLAEWRAELWQVQQSCNAETRRHDPREPIIFCLGAFKDALCLPRESLLATVRPVFQLGSPSCAEAILATLAAIALLLCLASPAAHRRMQPYPYPDSNELVTISHGGNYGVQFPTVRFADYESWSGNPHHLFSQVAFYQPITRRIHTLPGVWAELSIDRASDNIFDLLRLPVEPNGAYPASEKPAYRVVLSRSAWRKFFAADPNVVGRTLTITGHQAPIIGILADEDWHLPGRTDLWLLETPQALAALPASTRGFVLAHAAPSAFPASPDGTRQMTVFRGGNTYEAFDCVSLAEQARQPLTIFLFTLVLACLALPATTPLPLGEYPRQKKPTHWTTGLRRWAFLGRKVFWIAAIVYFASLAAAYANPAMNVATSQYIQLAVSFFGFLFAFRWALRDQRKRCPVCLRSLTNPARVGQASCNFLAWNGTELVCLGGHGLLHVPDIPTSWFSTQRWLYLDSSWSGLFTPTYAMPAGNG
jgi:hypothetical protein